MLETPEHCVNVKFKGDSVGCTLTPQKEGPVFVSPMKRSRSFLCGVIINNYILHSFSSLDAFSDATLVYPGSGPTLQCTGCAS